MPCLLSVQRLFIFINPLLLLLLFFISHKQQNVNDTVSHCNQKVFSFVSVLSQGPYRHSATISASKNEQTHVVAVDYLKTSAYSYILSLQWSMQAVLVVPRTSPEFSHFLIFFSFLFFCIIVVAIEMCLKLLLCIL